VQIGGLVIATYRCSRWSSQCAGDCSYLKLESDPAGAVVGHEAFQCSLQDDILVGDAGAELLPFVGYGSFDTEGLADTFFS